VREERSSHSGLPLAAGKLIYGRGYRNRTSARGHLRIRYTLRPHVIIRLLDHLVLTLMDTGSEISIINAETAERARNMQIRPIEEEGKIHLADGTRARPQSSLLITVQGRTLRHTFSVLSTLDSPVLLGIDLWARLGLAIPPSPRKNTMNAATRKYRHVIAGMTSQWRRPFTGILTNGLSSFRANPRPDQQDRAHHLR